ncbi:hypothetical protein EX30DRAFT_141877 [Ascodesmis nigricans]|uniref:Protein YAE1 n=1 Tax=Ascodesmis nigricans TaxID=341454 RepID=A0A4S2N193_9PEZI|nr:hypothetical protein EX30DRAFT_141877 [Ascodesmis nigricans]
MTSNENPPLTPPITPPFDPLADIFSTSRSPSPTYSHHSTSRSSSPHSHYRNRRATSPTLPPDLLRLRQTHNTEGYRAGITASKPLRIQAGFDESYPIGARIGEKVGWILGVLGGLEKTLVGDVEVRKLREKAERELARDEVLSEKWWDERGVWKWDVPEGEEVTLDDVVEAWPVWREWRERVEEVAGKRGLVVKVDGGVVVKDEKEA